MFARSSILFSRLGWIPFFNFIFATQDIPAQPLEYHFEEVVIPGEHQFPTVDYLYQDSEGFLWIGCYNGLYRYDGYELRHFVHDPTDSLSLGDNKIKVILEDQRGRMWIGTQNGLFLYDPRLEVFRSFADAQKFGIGPITIHCIHEDTFGDIWIGTNSGLHQYDPEGDRMTAFKKSSVALDNQIWELRSDSNGGFWIITDVSIRCRMGNDTITTIFRKEDLLEAGESFRNIYPKADDTICVISNLAIYDFATHGSNLHLISRTDLMLPTNRNRQIYLGSLDLPNQLLLGLSDGLLVIEKATGFQYFQPLNKDDSNHGISSGATALELVNNSQLWIGNSRGQLVRCNLLPISTQQIKIDIFSQIPFVTALFELHEYAKDTILMPYKEGGIQLALNEPISSQLTTTSQADITRWPSLMTTFEDDGEFLWIGTVNGLFRYDKKSQMLIHPEQLGPLDSLGNFAMRSLLKDTQGNLWVATWVNGVYRFAPEKKLFSKCTFPGKHSAYDHNLSGRFLYEDRSGHVWIGTRQGLFKYDHATNSFQAFYHDPADPASMSENTSFCIYEDSLGFIWSGSYGGGLNRLDQERGTFRHFTQKNGLLDNNIFSLLPDDHGNLWMSSFTGITKFNPYTFQITNYTYKNGLLNRYFDAFLYGKSPITGKMFFGGRQGIDVFHPDSLKPSDFKPSIVFTRFQLFNEEVTIQRNDGLDEEKYHLDQSISYAQEVSLTHDQKVFTISFAGLDFSRPDNIHYAYRLEGFDEQWQYVENQRSATYTNLDPGRYIFKVKCTNADQIWNSNFASLAIVINPPWWMTWWAYTIYLITLGGIVYMIYRYQQRRWKLQNALKIQENEAIRLKEMDALKTNLYKNITHEFRTPLTVIEGMASLIRKEPKKWLLKGVHTIEQQCNQLLQMVNQILDLQKIEAGKMNWQPIQADIISFINFVCEPFQFQAAAKGLAFDIDHRTTKLKMDFDPEKISILVANLVSNAIKYTSQGQIQLSTWQDDVCLTITVSDTGIGIAPDHLSQIFDRFYQIDPGSTRVGEGTGIGLALIKDMLPLMRGKIEVESAPDVGSKFTITLPITQLAAVKDVELEQSKKSLTTTQSLRAVSLDHPPSEATILLIEDNPDVRTYLRGILEFRYHLVEAKDGKEGIEKAIDFIPDLIISDVMMPKKDGYQVCDALHKNAMTSHIPIILLTAKADRSSITEGYRHGADVYLTKPFHAQQLEAQIEMLFEQRRRLQEKYQNQFLSGKAIHQQDTFLQQLTDLIQEEISNENLKTKDICHRLHISRSQLHQKVKALTGMSTSIFIRQVRLLSAKEMLIKTEKNISEIAYSVGFKDPNYFTRVFNREFGSSPTQVRNQES